MRRLRYILLRQPHILSAEPGLVEHWARFHATLLGASFATGRLPHRLGSQTPQVTGSYRLQVRVPSCTTTHHFSSNSAGLEWVFVCGVRAARVAAKHSHALRLRRARLRREAHLEMPTQLMIMCERLTLSSVTHIHKTVTLRRRRECQGGVRGDVRTGSSGPGTRAFGGDGQSVFLAANPP